MTHDELLAKIDERYWKMFNHNFQDQTNAGIEHRMLIQNQHFALRAVVELHKPIEQTTGASYTQENGLEVMETETRCFHCTFGTGIFYYPCPTIQAIEKELN